ncbi:MAG TPA: GIY-YIG nuclease family protein [bacterium]|nr:GIY-YIG nuclease family protein [bacterium]HOM26869.1 GIY-YIG nuclease family protein [bacterium]
MYYVYVIKSFKNSRRYVGFTSKNPVERLKEHNRGSNKWSRQNRPFELIYYEEFTEKEKARKRERFLKSGKGREFLNKIIKNSNKTFKN